MEADYFIGVAQQALWVLALGAAPILIPALLRESSGVGSEVLVLAQPDYLKVVDKSRHFAALASAPITDEDYDDLVRAL